LYNHVNGLPELRKQLAIYALGKLLEEMVDAALGRAGDEAVHAVALAYFNFARQHPGLYEASLSAPDPLDPDIHIIGDKIVDLILRVMEPYQLEGDDKIHAVRGLRSIVHGFAALEIKQQFNMSIDRSESL
ncbi:TetR family transcriptional regulator, partial [Clostridium perfringens]|nr:TetR family transcriptional regulator [Clostridium perfringens]